MPCKPVFNSQDPRDPNYNQKVYDPMWALIEETGMPVTFHIGTGRDPRAASREGGAVINYVAHALVQAIEPVTSLCASGVLERFPKIKFAAIESGIGWVPWMLDAMDEGYIKHHMWALSETEDAAERVFSRARRGRVSGGSRGPRPRQGIRSHRQFSMVK